MKKAIASLILCFMVFGVSNAICAQRDNSDLELGAEISHIKYEEPGIMESKGIMYGIAASYTSRGNLTLKLDGRVAFGEVDYEGSGRINDVDDFIFEFRLLCGKEYRTLGKATIMPYIGIGYRYLNDDSGGRVSSTGRVGYERESTYHYIPLGIEILSERGKGWSVGAVMEYDYFWKGEQKSHLSDADPGLNDLKNDQDDGYGLRASLKFMKKSGTTNFMKIEPFIRYWNIKQSDEVRITYYGIPTAYVGYEPKNKSREVGINFSLSF